MAELGFRTAKWPCIFLLQACALRSAKLALGEWWGGLFPTGVAAQLRAAAGAVLHLRSNSRLAERHGGAGAAGGYVSIG